ncbi:hypothetical protein HWV62_20376 [Athelia sp. TMB]|nr:hypothetical protein HWV62_20376 [Athelia sp. TMB]
MKFTSVIVALLALPAALASAIPRTTVAKRATIETNGTYKITSAFAPSVVIDLSAGDNKSIIAYPYHSGANQQWIFNNTQGAWTIKNVELGLYIAPGNLSNPSATPGNYTTLSASSTPFIWDIWHDEVNPAAYRLFIPRTALNWDLTDFGNSTPGNPIQVFQKYTPGWKWQTWTVDAGECFAVGRGRGAADVHFPV